LFKGTIKSNITYGFDEEVADDDKRLLDAIDISGANFVLDMEKGVNSEVSQGGTNFSGGQKQRISIARAVFKGSEIIAFDDSFSALDYKTDALVRNKIKKNLKDKTIIIVAQRIGTIMNADKIIVLDEGKVVGMGTHKDLLESCTVYKEIALSQLSKEEL
ncbi:MAG: ABC transporter ATP-binding protein, partial [Clostridia bacterium]|nr:ABC transporter ATP-binding protein [Clostridia bacterium]